LAFLGWQEDGPYPLVERFEDEILLDDDIELVAGTNGQCGLDVQVSAQYLLADLILL